jgi:transcriptional regulator with XRE-family HTH domain
MSKETEISQNPKEDPRPSEEGRNNAQVFDWVARDLGLTDQPARSARWITRVGLWLRRARRGQKLEQGRVAREAGITQSYLSRLENGLLPKRGPTMDVLLRCAESMGCVLDVTLRSKVTGAVLSHLSSGALDRPAAEESSPDTSVQPMAKTGALANLKYVDVFSAPARVSFPVPDFSIGLFGSVWPPPTAQPVDSTVQLDEGGVLVITMPPPAPLAWMRPTGANGLQLRRMSAYEIGMLGLPIKSMVSLAPGESIAIRVEIDSGSADFFEPSRRGASEGQKKEW